MLGNAEIQAASDLLFDLWRHGRQIDALPPKLRPAGRADGYRIQALLEKRSGAPLFGWKIAATSRAGQAHIAVDGPLAGRLLAERAFPSGAERPFGANCMGVAEAEFAFRMGRDLAPRAEPYGESEALAAVESLHPAIEIPDSRFIDFTRAGEAQLIADNACAREFALGEAAPELWRTIDLAAREARLTVRSSAGGETVRRGRGSNVLGSPLTALAWLVNELSSIGATLRAGEVVTTGTCVAPPPIGPGDRIEADFGSLGAATLRLGEAVSRPHSGEWQVASEGKRNALRR